MTLHRLIGGKKLIGAAVIAVTAVAIVACVPPKPPTPPTTTTTTVPGSTTTTTAGPTTTTTTVASTTTTTVPTQPNPTLTLGGSTPVALPVGASAAFVLTDVGFTSAASVGLPTYLSVCFENASSPTFNSVTSCSNDSELRRNPSSASFGTFANYPIFHGAEPTGDLGWGLYGAGETVPSGVTGYTTGYLRFAYDFPGNTVGQQFVPFTFSVS